MRIARELHDIVAHAMSIIAVRSGVARLALQTRPEEAWRGARDIEGTSHQALQELAAPSGCSASETEDPSIAGTAPGLADLRNSSPRSSSRHRQSHIRVEGQPRRLPPGVDLSAYRIIQEALTNVVRHAAPPPPNSLCTTDRPRSRSRSPTTADPAPVRFFGQSTEGAGMGWWACANESPSTAANSGRTDPSGFRSSLVSPPPEVAMSIGVVIADDQALVRGGSESWSSCPRHGVVGKRRRDRSRRPGPAAPS